MHFDLADMRLIVRIAEHNSLTKGAESSHLSVPAASIRIKKLEESVGARLLYRGSQGVRLTPPGEAFVRHARTVLVHVENLRGDLKDFARGVKGRLRIGTTAAVSGVLAPVLGRYLLAHPEVSIELREQADADVVRAVAEDLVDLGVLVGPVSASNIEVIPFRQDGLALVVWTNHRFACRTSIGLAETADEDFVGATLTQSLSDRDFPDQPLRTRMECGDAEVACRLVEAKVGVSVMPLSVALRHARSLSIAVVPLSDAWAARSLKICVRSAELLPVHCRALLDALFADEGQPIISSAAPHG